MRTLVLLAAPLLLQAPADGPRGAIRGRFVSGPGPQGLRGVTVQVWALIDNRRFERSAVSSADGSFSLEQLPAGSYSLSAHKSGYQEADSFPARVHLDENQVREGLQFRFHRHGVISGRVTDAGGEPVINAGVVAYRVLWMEGQRLLAPRGRASTDDRGLYRLTGLTAGRYLVAVTMQDPDQPEGELELTSVTYSESGWMRLNWGQELSEVSFVLRPQAGFSLGGVVADAETGGPCRNCTIRITRLGEMEAGLPAGSTVSPDGSYRVRGLTPGSYRVVAEKPAPGRRHTVAARTVSITNRPLKDVHLVAGVDRVVAGRVVLESPPPSLDLKKVEARVLLREGRSLAGAPRLEPDLSFEIRGLAALTYRVQLAGTPPLGYFRTLRLGGRELASPEVDVPEEGGVSGLEVVVAFDSAALSGAVKPPEAAARGHRVTAARILIFPLENQSPYLVERRANLDAEGSFSFTGVAPGAYMVFAMPIGGAVEIEDPEVRRRFAASGTRVDLTRGQKTTVELALTPDSEDP